MALVAHSDLPAFATMRDEGVPVIQPDEAAHSGLAHLSIGLLNLMPDAALRATDRQFMRLVAAGAGDFDIWVYPFTVAAEQRSQGAQAHIAEHYHSFSEIEARGVDALIVTGANPARHRLEREAFWEGLGRVLDWAVATTSSVLCSCLATHVVVQRYRDITRSRLPEKRWGVYTHPISKDHPLLEGLSGSIDAPHSHWYDVSTEEFESVGLTVVLQSEEAGAHMVVSEDDFFVFFQGHPEYDEVSLLKEYKRDVGRYMRGERADYPPLPEHYFNDAASVTLDGFRRSVEQATTRDAQPPPFPVEDTLGRHANTWTPAGKTIYRNWLRSINVSVTAGI